VRGARLEHERQRADVDAGGVGGTSRREFVAGPLPVGGAARIEVVAGVAGDVHSGHCQRRLLRRGDTPGHVDAGRDQMIAQQLANDAAGEPADKPGRGAESRQRHGDVGRTPARADPQIQRPVERLRLDKGIGDGFTDDSEIAHGRDPLQN